MRSPNGGGRSVVTGTALIVAGVLPGFLTASLAPRIRDDFSFGDSTLGLAVAIFYLTCTAFSTPSGHLVERIGARRGMLLGAALTATACLAVAALAQSAAALIAVLLVGGLGNAIGGPAVSALLRRTVDTGRHGLAFGAQQSGASIGALLAGVALPAVAIPFGWRWAYVVAAGLAVAAVVLAPVPGPGEPPRLAAHAERAHNITSIRALAVAAVLASAAGVGFISFLVTYSVDQGIGEGAAGLLLGAVSLAATISRVGLGVIADRSRADPLRLTALTLAGSVAGYLLLIAGEPAVIVLAALVVGSIGWSWPGTLTLAVVFRRPEAPAWAVGVMMSGLFAGAAGGPLLVGLLAEHDHFTAAWSLCAGLALAAAVTIALTRRFERAAAAPVDLEARGPVDPSSRVGNRRRRSEERAWKVR
ncbi:MAG TPA: MFS transporter [Solirubrobacterales bacterium]|nr:MFS transporter [Solirubrobacterales bacterium]